jgi:hypothetical protein
MKPKEENDLIPKNKKPIIVKTLTFESTIDDGLDAKSNDSDKTIEVLAER